MNNDVVTVVVSTYGRPDALVCALESVRYQTHPHWQVLVVGDCCDQETQGALQPFLQDSRFRYVNLPFRCGEQSLPNAAGMATARTEWLALLNQDDVWMPWHLELAVKSLESSQAEFLVGRSAWTWGQPVDGRDAPLLYGVTPAQRNGEEVFKSGFHLVEPASGWVVHRSVVERVGPWRHAMHLYRPPIQEWYLRAWRVGIRTVGSDLVSSIKFENHWAAAVPSRRYDTPAWAQTAWLRRLTDPDLGAAVREELRQLCADPSAEGRGMSLAGALSADPRHQALADALLTREFAEIYRRTGLDSYTWMCAEAGLSRGWRWRRALKQRTGEEPPRPPKLDEVVAFVKSALVSLG